MPQLLPVLVYYGATYLGASAGVAMLASAATSAAVASRARRKARAAYNASLRDQTVTLKGGVNPRPIVYGRTAVGGQVIYAESTGAKKEHLILVVALAHGEIDAIETVYFNDVALDIAGNGAVTTAPWFGSDTETVTDDRTVPSSGPYTVSLSAEPTGGLSIQYHPSGYGGDSGTPPLLSVGTDYTVSSQTVTFNSAHAGRSVQISYERATAASSWAYVYKYTGGASQDISAIMATLGAPSWTAADKCQGIALLVLRLTWAEDIWPTGIPNIKAVVRGRKVYDPRSGLTVWSQNAAVCSRDYLTFLYGVNAASAKIDDATVIAAANICDEDVQLDATPTYQDRYTFNGVLSTGDDRLSNIGLLEQAMAGGITYSQGKWRVRAGAYTAPALTLSENDLADSGEISVVPFTSRRDLVNGAKGTFLNADAGYIEDQFPEWSSATFVTEDGGAAMTTAIALPMVTDHIRAQRLAKIAVYRAREQLTLTCHCKLTTYAWQVGDMVGVTLSRYGFTAKPFRILERGFSVEGALRYVLREEPNGIYDWNLGEASVLTGAANTALPDPTAVLAPTITSVASAGYVYKGADGTFVARILVGVDPPDDEYVLKGGRLQLRYRRGDWAASNWLFVEAAGDATQIWIDPAIDQQNYLIQVRAINNAGYVSAWSAPWAHTVAGRRGDVANLLRNSDFTEDLGYGTTNYADARALRHWSAVGGGIITPAIGRNFESGKRWNIGLGGAWMYQLGSTPGGFEGIYQEVPAVSGVEYEASIYVSPHRCAAYMNIAFLDSGGNILAQPSPDTIDAGTANLGGEFDPMTHPRLWVKGTAPANTVAIRYVAEKLNTTAGQADSYGFFSKAMLCVAPDDVTRETATPWSESQVVTLKGQSLDLLTKSTKATPTTSAGSAITHDSISFTPLIAAKLLIDFRQSSWGVIADGVDGMGLAYHQRRPRLFLRVTSGGATVAESEKQVYRNYSTADGAYYNESSVGLVATVPANTAVVVSVMVDPDPADAGGTEWPMFPKGAGFLTVDMKTA